MKKVSLLELLKNRTEIAVSPVPGAGETHLFSNFSKTLLIFFLLVNFIYPQEKLGFKKGQKVEVNELEVFSDRFFKELNIESNRVLAVLVKDNKTFLRTYPEHSISFSELTRYNSKVLEEIFVLFSILQLQELEKLNLRGDIQNYKFRYDKNFKQNILIENVLTHTTGIQENSIFPSKENDRNFEYWKSSPPVRFSEPNEFISYNPDHLLILKLILQGVTEKQAEEFIQESVISKFNLENTQFENEKLSLNGKDLEKILSIFAKPEELENIGIIKKETWKEILQEKFRFEDKLPGAVSGFFEHYENKIWGYTRIAESNDFTEQILFFPEKNSALYIYTDSYNPKIRRDFIASFLDTFYPTDKIKVKRDKTPGYAEYLKNFEGEYSAVQISSQDISKFKMYTSAIRITQNNGMLLLESGEIEPYGDLDGQLEFIEVDPFLFRSPDRETYISFKMNDAGDVEYLLSGSGQHGAYKKKTFLESKVFHESICIFFLSFYCAFLCLLLIEFPYRFAKKLAYSHNSITRNVQILLWLEVTLALVLFGSFYYFIDNYNLIRTHEYFIDPSPYDYTIFSIPFVFIFGISLLSYFSIRAFLDRNLHFYRQVQVSLFVLVSIGFIYWMSYWNLLGYAF